ncbi:MAG: glycosyltransferase [Nitrososphaeria archaeon]|nr:glycosyltransferase [Nitrosopumilaceae archaeon]NDF29153.1 glycosyltransferase [Nitrososphaeria archaeon]NDF34266.1 glycosyltransferase [Nitrosopumilaceae archaeon]NDF47407.1 glycosyltransferase [Nitrosopumilaceae archaeon]
MIDIVNYVFVAILVGISLAWIVLIKTMSESFRHTPILDKFESKPHHTPKVSVILPARNEEGFIQKCLDSLIQQDYANYEIIAIDDSSDDSTGKIISEYSKKNSKVIHVSAEPKPEGWMGKNWACMQGYKKATGELFLFTDADTSFAKNVISLAVSHLESASLDALTVIPKMVCLDPWTKISLPVLSTFLHTRFSAIRVNDPTKKTGYFFGSFFIIRKTVYDSVGTHEGVKNEIIEDGALGKKVKEGGFKMKMVLGNHLIEAVWARDWSTLWNALKRLMIPLFLQNGKIAVGIFFAVLFLLFMPYVFLAYSAPFATSSTSFGAVFVSSAVSSALLFSACLVDAKALGIKMRYAILAPLGSLIVVCGFLSGLIQAKGRSAVSWRGRTYSMKDHSPDFINV